MGCSSQTSVSDIVLGLFFAFVLSDFFADLSGFLVVARAAVSIGLSIAIPFPGIFGLLMISLRRDRTASETDF